MTLDDLIAAVRARLNATERRVLSAREYLRATPQGRLALTVVWAGFLGLTVGFWAYVPMVQNMKRQGLIRHTGAHYVVLVLMMILSYISLVLREQAK